MDTIPYALRVRLGEDVPLDGQFRVMKRTTAISMAACGDDASAGYRVSAVGPEGAYDVHARSVVLATGSRERSAGQIDLNGDRPAGVYTAGCAQNFVNLMGTLPGRESRIFRSHSRHLLPCCRCGHRSRDY